MNDVIIKIENLSKQYRLGQVGTGTISHDLNRWWHTVRGKEDPYLKIGQANDRTQKGVSDYVWAIKDINFDVQKGEVLGIIGKNGAGKSTLLKILSKVTGPTTGSIKAKGRIASLLEVGTGFHPEMTGRENIFMNGTIMGMNRHEIAAKLDEIVEFAGIAMYLDTPVKRYSSGMMVRLGFAIAAHLEPEILIVDEVLAVGDIEFQKKAIGKMKHVSEGQGRTVIFVSHNMAAVEKICNSAFVMNQGKIVFSGESSEAIAKYIELSKSSSDGQDLGKRQDRQGSGEIRYKKITFLNDALIKTNIFRQGETMKVLLDYEILNTDIDFSGIHFSLNMLDMYGKYIFCHQNLLIGRSFSHEQINNSRQVIFELKNIPFAKGEYLFNCDIVNRNSFIDMIENVGSITIQEGKVYNYEIPMTHGLTSVQAEWSLN